MVFFSEDSSLEEGTDFVADEGRPRVTPQSGRGAGTWAAEGGRSIAHRQRRCRRRDGVERQEEPPWRWCPASKGRKNRPQLMRKNDKGEVSDNRRT